MSRLPSSIKFRDRHIPGWASVFRVPNYIVRIDIDEQGKAGTHGWQVRYHKPFRFFSDSNKDKRGSPAASLKLAKAYLGAIYEGPRSRIREVENANKKNPLGVVGIRVIQRPRPLKGFQEVYIEVSSPQRGKSAKRLYVGTENTITEERMAKQMTEAIKIRKAMVLEHKQQRGNFV